MSATITVLYPSGTTWNSEYYSAKHLPMVTEKLSKHGLLSWRFTSLVLPGGATSPYSHQLELVFKDDQGIATAFRDEAEPILG